MDRAESPSALRVVVAYSPGPRAVIEVSLLLAAGATVLEALQRSGLLEQQPEIDLSRHTTGIWGERRALDAALRDGDRVEIYRPLQVDPKEARRARQHQQRAATCTPKR